MRCVCLVLLIASGSFLWSRPSSWTEWKKETLCDLSTIPGWCSKEKAEKIMDFLHRVKPKRCVEIGACGGSTTYPIARSLQYSRKGVVWAVDAWDRKIAAEGFDSHDPGFSWWMKEDMNDLYRHFLGLIERKKLSSYCRVLRLTSQAALKTFPDESLDFVYLDGSASEEMSLLDASLSYRKVRRGGYIWLNDSHCESKLGAVAYLMERCEWLEKYSLSNRSIVFKKS